MLLWSNLFFFFVYRRAGGIFWFLEFCLAISFVTTLHEQYRWMGNGFCDKKTRHIEAISKVEYPRITQLNSKNLCFSKLYIFKSCTLLHVD